LEPERPVSYIDHPAPIEDDIAQPGLADVPANTAPIVFLLSSLAFFTWSTAKIIWVALNLALMS